MILLSKNTKRLILVILIVVLFGSVIVATNEKLSAIVVEFWGKFETLLRGIIT